ncbi:hypothetical protein ALC60_14787 [Trachymyrmex zeteki]|uniref:Uncharacterized protein n=1 Tax=Mycetomoellerius zeteki TaxID=64791 RepID=A0A151WF03_9HYME|nr:hypothetical protein ALC60_14787 [Trachymyrmex zeteki]
MKLKKRKSLCAQCVNMPAKVSKKVVGMIIRSRKSIMKDGVITVPMIFVKSHSLTPLAIIISDSPLSLFPVAVSRCRCRCYQGYPLTPAHGLAPHPDIRSIPVCLPTPLLSRVPILSSRNVA